MVRSSKIPSDVMPGDVEPGGVVPGDMVAGGAALIAEASLVRLPPYLGSEQTCSSQTPTEFLFM